jgi:hypothetical protein
MTDQAKHDFSHDQLISAMGAALRSVSIKLIGCVGIRETQSALFAEALSVAQANMTHGEIAILLRGMAEKIDSGELENTSIQ